MIGKDFWYDVLRSGAILGSVMALSRIVEMYLLAYSGLNMGSVSMWFLLEWVVAAAIFIWLLVRLSKRRAAATDSKYGYSYSVALAYILMVSMLAGVMVGVADTLFIGIMGYDAYIDGMVGRIDEMRALYASMNINSVDADFNEMASALRAAERPSMVSTVFSMFNTYVLTGGLLGLIIAGAVCRKPQVTIDKQDDNE
ncbi:MAG: DUF4199 family protein [Alistipes sp.]|nr:DUF4199 family protein [Alistipes sp.]